MTIRILFFTPTGSVVGGVETWLDRACEFLARHGFDPLVGLARGQVCNDPDRFRRFHPDLNTVEVDGRGLNREGRVRAVMRCIKQCRPRIVLPLGLLDVNEAVIRTKLQNRNVRLVSHAQGNLPPMLADLRDDRDHFDHVVCPGALTRRFLIEAGGFEPDRVGHIPNGADGATRPRVARKPGETLRLGYVGRFTRGDKRVLDLPVLCQELTKRSVPFQLTIVGDGPSREELAARLAPYTEQVRLLSPKPQAEVYSDVYPQLDCLLLFSSSETFGIVLAEAMMNGVVPVTSQYLGYHSEQLVVDRVHGLSFPVGDVAGAADAVMELSKHPELLDSLSRNASLHVESTYTWERSLSSWRDCLEMVAERPSRPPTPLPIQSTGAGRLDRLGVPPGITDALRRIRRSLIGSATPAGGEEWPLFHQSHPRQTLEEVQAKCEQLERQAAGRNDGDPESNPATVMHRTSTGGRAE